MKKIIIILLAAMAAGIAGAQEKTAPRMHSYGTVFIHEEDGYPIITPDEVSNEIYNPKIYLKSSCVKDTIEVKVCTRMSFDPEIPDTVKVTPYNYGMRSLSYEIYGKKTSLSQLNDASRWTYLEKCIWKTCAEYASNLAIAQPYDYWYHHIAVRPEERRHRDPRPDRSKHDFDFTLCLIPEEQDEYPIIVPTEQKYIENYSEVEIELKTDIVSDTLKISIGAKAIFDEDIPEKAKVTPLHCYIYGLRYYNTGKWLFGCDDKSKWDETDKLLWNFCDDYIPKLIMAQPHEYWYHNLTIPIGEYAPHYSKMSLYFIIVITLIPEENQ